ncbi:hypothetical protein BVRB_9g208460 [Beta vulgaris subsp. vulgaris]|nr:hypothetical protein BVRB_9g208460 [Beta vulgaris subsp. vulgaris]
MNNLISQVPWKTFLQKNMKVCIFVPGSRWSSNLPASG